MRYTLYENEQELDIFLHFSCQSRVQGRLFLASVMKVEVIIALIALFGSCVAVSR